MKTAVKSTVGVQAAAALETCMKQAEKYEKAVIKNQDPEDLHQLRVQLRRLRTAMQVFAPSLRLPKTAREAQVAKVARQLGKQRDLDVIGIILRDQIAPDLPDVERTNLATVLNYLEKRQKKAHKKVKRELKGNRYAALKSSLHKWAASPDCKATARLSIAAVLPDLMMPLVSQLWLHPGWLTGTHVVKGNFTPDTKLSTEVVDAIVADQSSSLHSLRKQVKRVRYQLKFVSEHYDDRLDADLERFSDLQNVLGTLQDSLVLEDFLAEALPDWQMQMPTLKSLLVNNRHRAWQQWQSHQAYFLNPENREALRQILLTPGTQPTKSAPEQTSQKSSTKSSKSASNRSKTATKSGTKRNSSRSKSAAATKSAAAKSARPSSRSTQADNNGKGNADNSDGSANSNE